MKQILTPEDINFLEEQLKNATPAPWEVMEKDGVDSAWVVPSVGGAPVSLFDYGTGEQNKSDAHFVASARNYMTVMLGEIKNLRKRVLELIQANNMEIQHRMNMQEELNEIKKLNNEHS